MTNFPEPREPAGQVDPTVPTADTGAAQPADGYASAVSVTNPDDAAARRLRALLRSGGVRGSFGRLGEIAGWASAVQGRCPPRRFARVRLLRIGPASAQTDALAEEAGATVRPVEVGASVESADAAGRGSVDAEVDAGADLFIPAAPVTGIAAAAAAVAALTSTEPVAVLGWPTAVLHPDPDPLAEGWEADDDFTEADGKSDDDRTDADVTEVDDDAWMQAVASIRDALRRVGSHFPDASDVLREVGDPALAAVTGMLVQAAARRTPVLLDGVTSGAAALLAHDLAPGADRWWLASHRSPWPAHRLALERLDLEPMVDFAVAREEGVGALLALPLLQAAVTLVAGSVEPRC